MTRTDPQARERGFSLVELLVVIAILGVLVAIAMPILRNQRVKANDAANKASLKSLANAMEEYITNNPNAIGTTDAVALKDAGYRSTQNVYIFSTLNSAQGGYCLIVRSTNAQDSGGGYPFYMEWDSLRGGLLASGAYRDLTILNPAGGACGAGRGAFVLIP